jgi:uncharacterized protein YndB with AHSA1/START domain
MKSIKQSYQIKAPISKVWQALVDPDIISKWSKNPAIMDDKVGTEFKLWGEEIYGENTKIIPNKLLEQDWSDGDFAKPSFVRFELSEHNDITTIDLTQDNVPDDQFDDINNGWEVYYLGPLKELMEAA